MNSEPLPEWLQQIIFLIIFVSIILAGIGNIMISKQFEEARQKDPHIFIIE